MVTAQVASETIQRQGYNVGESAKIIGIGRTTMHKLIREGHVRAVKLGTRTIISQAEIDRLLNSSDAA